MTTYIRPLSSIRLYYHVTLYAYNFEHLFLDHHASEVETDLKQKSNTKSWTLHKADCQKDRIFLLLEIDAEESIAEVVTQVKDLLSEKLVTENPTLIHLNPQGALFESKVSVYTAGIPFDFIAPSLKTT